MALLQRTRILPQQRLDLPDFKNIEDFVCADLKAGYKNLWANENFVFKGFECTGTGTDTLSIAVANAALLVGADDGTMFIGAPSLANVDTDALTPAATNYVEISIEQDTGGADSRAFWDPTANGGEGGEFSQIVDTFIFTKVKLNINTSNFTGSAQNVPICEVDVNGSGIITAIRDSRNLFWRLGRRGASNHTFPWVSRTEPPSTQFSGADKDIKSFKDLIDALESRILELSGTTDWFENAGVSLVGGFRNSALSIITAISTDAKWTWDGSVLKLSDSNLTPADADNVAALRLLDSTVNLMLTRQDGTGGSTSFTLADGDVLWVKLPDPLANVNYTGIGLTASNFRISARGSVPNDETTFWLAFREGANCFLRNFGELQPGEIVEISDNINENILAAIGIALETDMPNYTSNNYLVDGTSLVAGASALDAELYLANVRASQDRSSKLIEGGTWSLDYLGTTLSWSADAFIDVPEVTRVSNRILSGNVTLPNPNSVAYVDINRTSGPATLTVNVADVDAVPYSNDIVIIARRVGAGILVGQHSFLLKPSEKLELDGALAEINRLLGQLRITKHETAANKARISTADIALLNGDTLSQIIGDFLLKFDGAVINFTTGVINKADDVTPLGVNFTPFTVPAGQYFWYGLSLLPDTINADNTQNATVQVDLADSANASASAALKAVISGDIKLGQVQVYNNAGNIEVFDVHRLGVGSGSGSGSGDASAVDTALRDRFALNNMLYLTENIFRTDKATKLGVSTGAYSPAKKAFGFSAAAQTMRSINHLDTDFLDASADITEVEFYLFWLQGFIDTAATYEVSRDGGVNWQTASMSRIGETNAYRAYHTFTDEVTLTNLDLVAPTGAGAALNATTNQQLASKLVMANAGVLRSVDFNLNYGGAGVGTVTARLVKDNAGSPSISVLDILSESDAKTISSASLGGTGDITVTFNMPDVVLAAGTYHLVLLTDAAYKAGTMDLSWRSAAGTDGATFNGTSWTPGASSKAHIAKGRLHDLQVRVTSSAGDKYIEGYGIYYGLLERGQALGQRKIQKFVFSGDENRTDFTVNFELDPEIVTVYDPFRGQTYVVEDGVLRNEGNTLKFEPNTFNFPGETIVLHVRQLEGNGTDTSNANAAAISEIQFNLLDIGEELASISNSMVLPKVATPFTTILNRALMPDLSQDLSSKFAPERIMTQQIFEITDEQGPNGETVFGVVNDKFNQIRFVGSWNNQIGIHGSAPWSNQQNSYVEVSFYGTGLNVLGFPLSGAADTVAYSVDGGALTGNILITGASSMLASRNYSINTVLPVVANLALGFHTIRLVLTTNTGNAPFYYGFEILTEQAAGLIRVLPGAQYHKGKKRTHSILETTPYNSSFETGTLGSKGGRVLQYQKADGSIAKAINPTDASQLNLAAANHANEDILDIYHIRDFGAGRSDDFSLAPTNSGRSFAIDDGSTVLSTNNGSVIFSGSIEGLMTPNTNDYSTFTFIGTGLDIRFAYSGAIDSHTFLIDNTSIGSVTSTNNTGFLKVVSGLPFGSHTVKILRNASAVATPMPRQFIVYGPKKPTLPTGAVELAEYFIPATFVANSTAQGQTTSTGVIQKSSMREFVYVNGTGGTADWALNITNGINTKHGSYATSDRLNAYVEYTFFGTGFDSRWVSDTTVSASNIQASLQSLSTGGSLINLTSANFPTASFSTYGMSTGGFTAGTGILNTRDGVGVYGAGFICSGLPLGLYKIRFNNNSSGVSQIMQFQGLDIIAAVYSPKTLNSVVLQNAFAVGSQGISDLRKFSEKDISEVSILAQAVGVNSGSTTTSIPYTPVPNMTVKVKSKGQNFRINYIVGAQSPSAQDMYTSIFINQKQELFSEARLGSPSQVNGITGYSKTVYLSEGEHSISVFWRVTGATATLNSTNRILTVEEV